MPAAGVGVMVVVVVVVVVMAAAAAAAAAGAEEEEEEEEECELAAAAAAAAGKTWAGACGCCRRTGARASSWPGSAGTADRDSDVEPGPVGPGSPTRK
jgi:type II secretory pathway pseudopilin PulG